VRPRVTTQFPRRSLNDNIDHITNEEHMEQVIENIVGQKVEQALAWKDRHVSRATAPLLEVEDLVAVDRVHNISVQLYPGEILGLAGLMGS